MGIWIKDIHRIRKKDFLRANKIAGDFKLIPHSLEEIRRRRDQLSKSKFKSEIWFCKKLLIEFAKTSKIIQVARNVCILNLFYADFVFLKKKIVVEIDGSSHEKKQKYDQWRDSFILRLGYKIKRIPAFNEEEASKVIQYVKNEYRVIDDLIDPCNMISKL